MPRKDDADQNYYREARAEKARVTYLLRGMVFTDAEMRLLRIPDDVRLQRVRLASIPFQTRRFSWEKA